ncbi:anti-anti-sigma factor [Methanosarcinales archaeon]|uniref:Anti-sigma factor antagonist n=1 Tax=Candidatus Syntropharchaeum caldarium TaxID=1838285 RepID=A0A1F2P862_9EURY|nr:MAG: anti-sigma factor antagonist [Candidatus Syntrophoarchaeum caldarius]RLG33861.1 MAG: anti-anti-sigma factor [Methanosarcinales archaeon]
MIIPILKIGDVLIVTIQTELTDREIEELSHDILDQIKKVGARGVVIDISALKTVDSYMARSLNSIASASMLLGSETVVVGIQPAVALTLVELGLRVSWGVKTALNLEKGLEMLKVNVKKSG